MDRGTEKKRLINQFLQVFESLNVLKMNATTKVIFKISRRDRFPRTAKRV